MYIYSTLGGVREGVVTKVKAQQRICVMRARHLCGRNLDKKGLSWGLGRGEKYDYDCHIMGPRHARIKLANKFN